MRVIPKTETFNYCGQKLRSEKMEIEYTDCEETEADVWSVHSNKDTDGADYVICDCYTRKDAERVCRALEACDESN